MVPILILVQLLATLVMVGIIWFVQLVHYPLYAMVGEAGFTAYLKRHLKVTPFLVGPMILLECVSAVWLACVHWESTRIGPAGRTASFVGLALLAATLAVTFVWSEPMQLKLAQGFDAAPHRKLVATNWLRTAGWTGRGAVALWLAWKMMA